MGQKININPENAYFVTDQKLALHEKRLRNQKQHAHSGRKNKPRNRRCSCCRSNSRSPKPVLKRRLTHEIEHDQLIYEIFNSGVGEQYYYFDDHEKFEDYDFFGNQKNNTVRFKKTKTQGLSDEREGKRDVVRVEKTTPKYYQNSENVKIIKDSTKTSIILNNIDRFEFETLFLKASQFKYLCEKKGFKCECGGYPVIDVKKFYTLPGRNIQRTERFDFKCKNSECRKSSLKKPKHIEAFEHFRYNSLQLNHNTCRWVCKEPDLTETRLEHIERLSGCDVKFVEKHGLVITSRNSKHFWDKYAGWRSQKNCDHTLQQLLNNPRKLLYHNNQNKIITIRPELKNFSQKQLVERCYSKYFSHIKTVSVLKFSAPFSAKFSYMFDGTSSVNFTTHDIRVSTGERWKGSNFLKRYKDKINQQIFMEDSCVICFSDRPEMIFLPCGHFCMCSGCYGVYKTGLSYCRISDLCPICRKTINSTVQTNDL